MTAQTVSIDIPSAFWLTSNDRPHWAVRAKRVAAIRKLAGFATLARIRSGNLTPMQHADLTVHVYYPADRGQEHAGDEVQKRRFAAAGRTDDQDVISGIEIECRERQHVFAVPIAKPDPLKANHRACDACFPQSEHRP